MFTDHLAIDTWSDELCAKFNREFSVANHKLHEHDQFTKASIINLLDNLPKKQIQCYTMIADASNKDSIKAVDPDEASGAELYEAAESGMFWFNLKRLETFDTSYQQLLDEMFDTLSSKGAPLPGLHELTCDMLLTSPGAHTHYHIDRGPSALWHLVGSKKLWVYPSMDFDYISQEHMEAIFAGKMLEYLPYNEKFDEGSRSCLLQPGEVVWWENSAPHRVENNEMCVSINCSYNTRASVKRFNIQRANHYMMRRMKVSKPVTAESGLMADIKEFTYRASNRLLNYKPDSNYREDYATTLVLDASTPNYIVQSKSPRMPAFLS